MQSLTKILIAKLLLNVYIITIYKIIKILIIDYLINNYIVLLLIMKIVNKFKKNYTSKKSIFTSHFINK